MRNAELTSDDLAVMLSDDVNINIKNIVNALMKILNAIPITPVDTDKAIATWKMLIRLSIIKDTIIKTDMCPALLRSTYLFFFYL